MDTSLKKITPEEKENVLLVLNEFSEEYKANTKATASFMGIVKELVGKVNTLLQAKEPSPGTQSPATTALQDTLETGLEKIHTAVQRISFPAKESGQLSGQLETLKELLQQPVSSVALYQRYTPAIMGAAAGLFLCLCMVGCGWYNTAGKLDRYKKGQLKYRYLKLKSKATTKQILWDVDSLYRTGEVREDSVQEWEAEREQAAELNEQWNEKVGEGNNLQQQLEKLEQQKRDREQW